MAQYLTTYKKDYTWPSTRYKRKITSLSEYASCKCHDRPREIKPLVRCGDDYDWSRTGPMGRLLDPKLYPAKTGPHPETEATRFDQPATYMRKLEEKHPNLYGVLQSTPIDEVIKRVDEDRLKTTYQLDYSDKAAPMEDTGPPCGIRQEEAKDIDCRPSTRSKLLKVSSRDDRDKIGKRRSKKVAGAEDESQETRLLPWRSEYQDTISKLDYNRRYLQSEMDNHRETSSHREMHHNLPRYSTSNAYEEVYNSEHDIRLPEERSSVESVSEIEEPGINKNNIYYPYPNEPVYGKVLPKSNHATLRERYQRFNDYSELNMPEAVTAMQKLQRLKELQMKRDISERYYSQEIKRLIGEYYFGPRAASPSSKFTTGTLQSSSFHPSSGGRLKNNLEPCGTMTTITRLDCGCIQETTRPIFTTARGRVQRRKCNPSQDEKLLKLTSLNPQEHLFSSLEQPKDTYRAKMKKRFSLDSRICPKISPAGDQEFETENEKKNEEPEQKISEHISKTTSPQRKFSDTSATSY